MIRVIVRLSISAEPLLLVVQSNPVVYCCGSSPKLVNLCCAAPRVTNDLSRLLNFCANLSVFSIYASLRSGAVGLGS